MKSRFLIILASLFLSIPSFAQQTFFTDIISEAAVPVSERLPGDLRLNYHSTVYSKQPAFYPGGEFFIRMPDGTSKKITERSWQFHTSGGYTFTGVITGDENSSAVLSKVQNRWQGMIHSENKNYIFQQTGDEIFTISEVNDQSFVAQDTRDDMIVEESAIAAHYNVCGSANPCTANPVVINILVVYTPSARSLWGGTASAEAAITTAISNMNVANANSGVNPNISFNLAHVAEVAYTESGNTSTDLTRLANGSDGHMDVVQTLRATHQADLVSLVVGSPTSTCGLGYVNTNPTNYSPNSVYNVVIYNCVVSNLSMAHELGHNMGLRHDRHVDLSSTPCAHHHGYVNQAAFVSGAATNKRWRTILAYNDQCAASGFNCTRVNNWANPLITRNADPMGIAFDQPNPADEVYGINRFACVVASFQGLSVVPLQWINVRASVNDNNINVRWTTANESRQSHFIVELAESMPENFREVARVNAINGSQNNYSTAVPARPGIFFIRIKALDVDGKILYSQVIRLDNSGKLSAYISGGTTAPILHVRSSSNEPVSFELTDALGRRVAKGVINPALGYNYKLPVGLTGVYFVKVLQGAERLVVKVGW